MIKPGEEWAGKVQFDEWGLTASSPPEPPDIEEYLKSVEAYIRSEIEGIARIVLAEVEFDIWIGGIVMAPGSGPYGDPEVVLPLAEVMERLTFDAALRASESDRAAIADLLRITARDIDAIRDGDPND